MVSEIFVKINDFGANQGHFMEQSKILLKFICDQRSQKEVMPFGVLAALDPWKLLG